MSKHTVFDALHLHLTGEPKGNTLPDDIHIEEDTACFMDVCAKLEKEYVYIRDSGPAAWGARITIPANCCLSWDKGHTWFYTRECDSRFLTEVGETITLLYVDENDNLHYRQYIACDIDE